MSPLHACTNPQCPICFGSATSIFSNYPGYKEPDTYTVAACTNCKTAFIRERDENPDSIYEDIYKQCKNIPGYNRYLSYAALVLHSSDALASLAAHEIVYWALREHILRQNGAGKKKILEVGSGLGYLTYALNKGGFSATGIDVSAKAVAEANQTFGRHYFTASVDQYAAEKEGRYDLVIGTEVIEHVPDVIGFVKGCARLLAADGELFLTTPNRDACCADIPWDVEGPPVHPWWLSFQSLQKIGDRCGCSVRLVDLEKHSDAATWRRRELRWRPMPIKLPILDCNGNVISHSRFAFMHRRVWETAKAVARRTLHKRMQTDEESSGSEQLTRWPFLCAVFRKK